MISYEDYLKYCQDLHLPSLQKDVHGNVVESMIRQMARYIYRQRYADGIADQQNLLHKQGLSPVGIYPADMEARAMRYGASPHQVLTAYGETRPFFGCNVIVDDPSGKEKEVSVDGWDDPIPLPQKAGILSLWVNEDNDYVIWATCRNAEGEEFECPWAWTMPEAQ